MIAYRREIDGLRALAVVPVILFHAGFEGLRGGFVGVDVFFVISGYLITSIILSEKEAGTFRLAEFWERRARRILPTLFLVIAACIPAAFLLLDQFELLGFAKSVLGASLFYSNFHFWKEGGYFETAAELKPLLHTWSLAVEEQYYIFFPMLILLAWRFGKRGMVTLLALIALASFALCLWASEQASEAAFFLLPMRIWELAIGAFVALYCFRNAPPYVRGPAGELLSLAGLLLILFAFFSYSSAIPFPGLYALVPTLGAALLILFASPCNRVGRFLASSLMVGIGLVSYSAYLWHQPVFAFLRHVYDELGVGLMLFGMGCVFVLSLLSWKFVERPFRNCAQMPRARFFKVIASSGVTILLLGAAGAQLFSSKAKTWAEVALAEALVGRVAVYASNMDERLFVKNRILLETLRPDTLIIGSSRIMQLGEHVLGGKSLNLAVSGASLEDEIALTGLAFEKFKPQTLLIGGDPWLFNGNAGQKRWRSLADDYNAVQAALKEGREVPAAGANPEGPQAQGVAAFYNFYREVNRSYRTFPDHDLPETRAKIRADGSRVYGLAYVNRTPEQVLRGIGSTLDYSMKSYAFDAGRYADFERLLNHYKGRADVVIVLSPYHPAVYERMEKERQLFLEIEATYVEMGKRLGVRVLGSYNPATAGCEAADFYDGMHPRDVCMAKVLKSIRVQTRFRGMP